MGANDEVDADALWMRGCIPEIYRQSSFQVNEIRFTFKLTQLVRKQNAQVCFKQNKIKKRPNQSQLKIHSK